MTVRHLTLTALLRQILPFLEWPRLTPQTLKSDLLAGLTVSLLAIPQSLAYAQLAGVPPYYGLYAAFIPALVGALFGSSGILSTGPVALTSLLTAASIASLAKPGTEQFYGYVTLLALLSGLFQVGFGLARMGMLLNLLSHPVLMGFINAAALIIALSQFPALVGLSSRQTEHFLLDTWDVLIRMDQLHEISLAFGLGGILMLVAFRRFAPRLPGVLITVALSCAVSYAIGFAKLGGRVVGEIPTGLPGFGMPTMEWSAIKILIPSAFVIALISFMEAMSSCKVIAIKTRSRWDENQELIGQGLAKIAAAFCSSMPVSGSFSRSALNLSAEATTGLSSLVCAAFVLITLLFFTPYLYHLPKPILASIIILAVANLINLDAVKHAWLASRDDGMALVVTFLATLAFAPNIQNGILTGIMLSLTTFLYRRMRPRVVQAGLHPDGTLRDAARFRLPPLPDPIAALRFDASLHFVNVSYFEDAVLKLERDKPSLRFILIAANNINDLDASGVESLARLVERLAQSGITLAMSGAKKQVQDVMERTGLTKTIGEDNLFESGKEAIAALTLRC